MIFRVKNATSTSLINIGSRSPVYTPNFMSHEHEGTLELKGIDYLKISQNHVLTCSDTISDFEANPIYPFFYQDAKRTFFAEPESFYNSLENPSSIFWLVGFGERLADALGYKKFRFYNFSHPYVNDGWFSFGTKPGSFEINTSEIISDPKYPGFISDLNKGGISQLLKANTSYLDDGGFWFHLIYQPNSKKDAIDYIDTKFPSIKKVDFDEYGAYSTYNWELFFHAPLFIATRLSKNGKYKEAMKWFHYIFNPTTNELSSLSNPNARYWQVLPFKTAPSESLEKYFKALNDSRSDTSDSNSLLIEEWLDNPFKPFTIARKRIPAFMKNVIFKYVDNILAWGDDLFRIDTMESVNEATQLYVIAAHILGQRPQFIPKRGTTKSETYHSIKSGLDDFQT